VTIFFNKIFSGANTKNVVPYIVSGRVVNISKGTLFSVLNLIIAPELLPIQFFCAILNFSLHATISRSEINRSA
jgi:hypothetical protein